MSYDRFFGRGDGDLRGKGAEDLRVESREGSIEGFERLSIFRKTNARMRNETGDMENL